MALAKPKAMAHSGPFRCQCGQIHNDTFDGPSNDLLPFIDTTAVAALNAANPAAATSLCRPFTTRLHRDVALDSDEDAQLLVHVPFIAPVKIRAITIIGGDGGSAPRTLHAHVNREALDFEDAESTTPVQTFDLAAADPTGLLEYPTQFSRFQSVTKLSLFVADNHGAETTRLCYIGLKGVGTDYQRRAVECVYEVKPTAESSSLRESMSVSQVE